MDRPNELDFFGDVRVSDFGKGVSCHGQVMRES